MSGHSKWATTHRKKELIDAKRSAIFTKFSNNIILAARQGGGDIDANFKLRLAIEKAREINMPKDNIDRAVKKGTGQLNGAVFEEIFYEGIGPAKSAFIVEVVSDNKNRIVAEIKQIFSKYGGNLCSSGCVSWQFEQKGVISFSAENYIKKREEIELGLIDAGAEDIKEREEVVEVLTAVPDLQKIKEAVEKFGLKIKSAALEWVPKEKVKIDNKEDKNKIENFMDALDDNSDVQNFYTNVDI
ncbi:MAG: YebC/PmpR family DNA-binding transcriptional regulator [bacterium]